MATLKHVRIPRFLFRGFNRHSGGGISGLNTTEGIVPLAFLQGKDKKLEVNSMTESRMLRFLIQVRRHCCQSAFRPTPFSSWSHDWRTALEFARTRCIEPSKGRYYLQEDDGIHIAVLDTWALGDEEMLRNKIFHVPEIHGEHLNIPHINIPCEWLIWGPVSGPAYRCVQLSAIRQAINCRKWPAHVPSNKSEPHLVDTDIHDSLSVAECFQRKDDNSDDVMLAVAAAELASRVCGVPVEINPEGDHETDTVPIWPQDLLQEVLDIFDLCNPVLSGRPLVHGRTALVGFPRVKLMYDLLSKAEACWGVRKPGTNSDTAWAPVAWKQILGRNRGWRENSCGFCIKGGNS